jgi:AraC-like DNA-binding protein
MEYLQRHVTECVALQELAEVASVSKGYLAREFHRVIGLPPHAYHVQLRIARAARLLAMGTSLSRVALDAGFADQSHLSRKFKTAYGLTPLAFARAVRSRPLFSICTEHIVDGITAAGKRRSRLARSHLSTGDAAVESALRTDVAEEERCNFVQECR